MNIITDKTKLNAKITAALKQYKSAGIAIHVATVSALYHAAMHGDPVYINRIFEALRPNDQTAFKLFVRRCSAVAGLSGANPEGRSADEIVKAVADGSLVTVEKGAFVIVNGPNTDVAKLWKKLCEDRFIEPDGENDRMVLDRNNFAEVRTLGDTQVLDKLVALAKEIANDTDTRKVEVSDAVRKLVNETATKAASFKDQLSLDAA